MNAPLYYSEQKIPLCPTVENPDLAIACVTVGRMRGIPCKEINEEPRTQECALHVPLSGRAKKTIKMRPEEHFPQLFYCRKSFGVRFGHFAIGSHHIAQIGGRPTSHPIYTHNAPGRRRWNGMKRPL